MYIRTVLAFAAALLVFFCTSALAVQPLEIKSVVVDDTADPIRLYIQGENFLNGSELELTLGEDIVLVIDEASLTDTFVIATLPPGEYEGSYQLTATTGGGSVRFDEFDGVTIGAEGPQGPKGDTGPAGADGADGAPGAAGVDGADGQDGANCYDGIGTSVADCIGPQGPKGDKGDKGNQGEPGVDGTNGLPGIAGSDGQDGANCYDNIVGGTSVDDCIGPPGPVGPKGDPGDLALAGLECPSGQFLVGFTATGELKCSGGGTQEPPSVSDDLQLFFSTPTSCTNPGGEAVCDDLGPAVQGFASIRAGTVDGLPLHPTLAEYTLDIFYASEDLLDVAGFCCSVGTISIHDEPFIDGEGQPQLGRIVIQAQNVVEPSLPFSSGIQLGDTWLIIMTLSSTLGSDALPSAAFFNDPANFTSIVLQKSTIGGVQYSYGYLEEEQVSINANDFLDYTPAP